MTDRIQKKIIHVDMDAFYASVELRDRPELAGRPLVVGGDPHSRAVVSSASYEARRFGIRSAMSCAQAYRLCPQAIFVPPDFTKYVEASNGIQEIFLEVSDLMEPLSLDEAYLDVTVNKKGEPSATRLAMWIKEQIRARLNLTASAGVGPNKFIAKLASDMKKPDGLVVVPPEKVAEVIADLPIEKLWGVGPATAKRMHQSGIRTTRDIRELSQHRQKEFQKDFGVFFWDLAHGRDDREVETDWEPKSRGAETTFETDVVHMTEIMDTLTRLCEDVAHDLAQIERRARTVTLKVRYDDFSTITRSRTRLKALSTASEILSLIEELVQNTEAGTRPIRLLGVSVSGFPREGEPEQLWLPPPIS